MKIPEGTPRPNRGQIWEKKDTGLLIMLTASKKGKRGKCFNGKRIGSNKSFPHQIPEEDLRRFWRKI